jgi:hypothetical protein
MIGRLIPALRNADWLDRSRARAYRALLALILLGGAVAWVLLSRHGIDLAGKPLGTDFIAFWSAAQLALAATPEAAWNIAQISATERAAMPVDPGTTSFLYPPPFLLACLPFGQLPYFAALPLWLALTGAAYFAAIRLWLPAHRGRLLTIAAFPALVSNLGHGQNGFLTAALLGGGLWLLGRRPWIAGLLLGALVIKPQIALAVPILLIAGGHGRALGAALTSACALCLTATFCFGVQIWRAFFAAAPLGRAILDNGLVEPEKMVSLFAALRVLHASPALAYSAQIMVAMVAGCAVVYLARARCVPAEGQAAFAVAASLLMSPFLLDYDLTAAAVPLAWLFSEGVRRGFRPWEKSMLALAYVLPLIARPLALGVGLPVAPLILAALALTVARAAFADPEHARPLQGVAVG